MTDYQKDRIEAAAQALSYYSAAPLEQARTIAAKVLAAADSVPTPRDVIESQFKAEVKS